MANWQNWKDYQGDFDRAGWTWEFMRRNEEYREDYAHAQAAWKALPRKGHFTYGQSAIDADLLSRQLGAKWGQLSGICDPSNNKVPNFMNLGPVEPDGEEIESFYVVRGASDTLVQMREFATLTFDLRRPFAPQLARARSMLRKRKKQGHVTPIKPARSSEKQWRIYLRVLDAKEANASTSEIIAAIAEYEHVPKVIDAKYPAADRVSDHYKRAKVLRNSPLSLLL